MNAKATTRKPRTAALFLGAALVLMFSLALTYWTGLVALESQGDLAQSLEVIEHLEQVLSTVKDAETGQRGYLLTGEERYLEPYHEAARLLPGELAELSRLAARGQLPAKEIAVVDQLSREKLALAQESIHLRQTNGQVGAERMRASEGKQVMDALRQQIAGLRAQARLRFEAASGRAVRATHLRTGTFFGATLVNLAFLTWAYRRIQGEMRERQAGEERFHSMVEAMPQLAWIARADGYIVWYNQRWYEYTGTSPEQMAGWGWQKVHDPQMLPQVLEGWGRSLAAGQPFEMEFALRRADGQFRPFLTRVMPLKNNDGQVQLWFGTNTDITDLVAAREAQAQSRTELERLVVTRTSQLAEANANSQAFAATVAHDLRAPLRAIQSLSYAVIEDYAARLDDYGQDLLKRIATAAAHMERLLNDLLEYSRLNQAELELAPVSLQKAVQEALALLEADLRDRNARLQVEEFLPAVIGHRATVVLLINNLVANALKFTAPGVRPEITIGVQRRGEFVRLTVRDNGIGIAQKDLGRLFGAFQRLHGSHAFPGTGLGLAIVRKGAERMGGRVGVESEPGQGSRFWVELRHATGEEPERGVSGHAARSQV